MKKVIRRERELVGMLVHDFSVNAGGNAKSSAGHHGETIDEFG